MPGEKAFLFSMKAVEEGGSWRIEKLQGDWAGVPAACGRHYGGSGGGGSRGAGADVLRGAEETLEEHCFCAPLVAPKPSIHLYKINK